jgi:hypothetical protein
MVRRKIFARIGSCSGTGADRRKAGEAFNSDDQLDCHQHNAPHRTPENQQKLQKINQLATKHTLTHILREAPSQCSRQR